MVVLFLSSNVIFAQSASGSSNSLLIGILGFLAVAIVFTIVMVADHFLRISAKATGANATDESYSIFPRLSEFFAPEVPEYAKDLNLIQLTKGFDIPLAGAASEDLGAKNVTRYAINPKDFNGLSPIPKVVVEVGATVKAGDTLFFDKKMPDIKFAAPVSGEVVEVRRGEKRSIAEVIILADKDIEFRSYDLPNLEQASKEELTTFLLDSGVWPMIRQRPYNVVADPEESPRDIFVSTFDTAPLAPDSNMVIKGNGAAFQKGLDVLGKLTDGAVYVGLQGGENPPSEELSNVTGVEKTYFSGAHPAGVVGIQIHNTKPINKEEIVWTVGLQEVITIGRLFNDGKYDTSRLVALTGAELGNAGYTTTYQGAAIADLLSNNIKEGNNRLVSGDVLTGKKVNTDGFLGYFDDQVTVLQEGDYYEMFGWLLPLKPRAAFSKTFPTSFYPDKIEADTNTHGEHRAFVMTGQYEQVLPMDLYPQHLLKAILVNDFERMEGLGIYEVVEEDLALCEFVCTSKQNIQDLLRQGLDTLKAQG